MSSLHSAHMISYIGEILAVRIMNNSTFDYISNMHAHSLPYFYVCWEIWCQLRIPCLHFPNKERNFGTLLWLWHMLQTRWRTSLTISADTEARRCLCSAVSSSLIVHRTQLSTVGDRAFPVAAPRVRDGLPQHVPSPLECSDSEKNIPIWFDLIIQNESIFLIWFDSAHHCHIGV